MEKKPTIDIEATYVFNVEEQYMEYMISDAFHGCFGRYAERVKKEPPIDKPDLKSTPEIIMNGGSVWFKDFEAEDKEAEELNLEKIKNAFRFAAKKYPWIFEEVILKRNYDANSASAILEIAIWGDIIYG